MVHLYRAFHALQSSRDVEKTAEITSQQGIRADRFDVRDLIRHDARGEFGVLDAKGAPETAAHVGVRHFRYPDPHHPRQEKPRLTMDAEFPQSRAGIMVGDCSVAGVVAVMGCYARSFRAADIHEETRDLETPLGKIPRPRTPCRVVREQSRIIFLQHANARPGRRDDVIESIELRDYSPSQRTRVDDVSGIIERLSATGLLPR